MDFHLPFIFGSNKRNKKEKKLVITSPWGDADRDGYPNIFDCRPLNPKRQDEKSPKFKAYEKDLLKTYAFKKFRDANKDPQQIDIESIYDSQLSYDENRRIVDEMIKPSLPLNIPKLKRQITASSSDDEQFNKMQRDNYLNAQARLREQSFTPEMISTAEAARKLPTKKVSFDSKSKEIVYSPVKPIMQTVQPKRTSMDFLKMAGSANNLQPKQFSMGSSFSKVTERKEKAMPGIIQRQKFKEKTAEEGSGLGSVLYGPLTKGTGKAGELYKETIYPEKAEMIPENFYKSGSKVKIAQTLIEPRIKEQRMMATQEKVAQKIYEEQMKNAKKEQDKINEREKLIKLERSKGLKLSRKTAGEQFFKMSGKAGEGISYSPIESPQAIQESYSTEQFMQEELKPEVTSAAQELIDETQTSKYKFGEFKDRKKAIEEIYKPVTAKTSGYLKPTKAIYERSLVSQREERIKDVMAKKELADLRGEDTTELDQEIVDLSTTEEPTITEQAKAFAKSTKYVEDKLLTPTKRVSSKALAAPLTIKGQILSGMLSREQKIMQETFSGKNAILMGGKGHSLPRLNRTMISGGGIIKSGDDGYTSAMFGGY